MHNEVRTRVLIVDDNDPARAALRRTVNSYSDLHVIGEAVNGPDAIKAVGQLAPHLVLMDVNMPGMNGIEATAEIKRLYPDVRVLMVSMHSAEEYADASLRAGADGYIVKDAGIDELRGAIRTVLLGKTYVSLGRRTKSSAAPWIGASPRAGVR